jgi:homocysteine S-methyltransferase
VFVVTGDPTEIGDYPDAMDNFDLVPSGLVRLIKQSFNSGVDHAGAGIGQPTSFFVGCALDLGAEDADREIKNLYRKIRMGADFILTQPVFEPEVAERFLQRFADQHGPIRCLSWLASCLWSAFATPLSYITKCQELISLRESDCLAKAGERAPGEGITVAVELVEAVCPWQAACT